MQSNYIAGMISYIARTLLWNTNRFPFLTRALFSYVGRRSVSSYSGPPPQESHLEAPAGNEMTMNRSSRQPDNLSDGDRRNPKKKVALVVAYDGSFFVGSQYNPQGPSGYS